MRHTRETGFSLIEVLVALSVLALTLGVVFQSYSLGLRSIDASEAYLKAAEVAQTRLALIGREVAELDRDSEGEAEDGLRWRVTIEPYESEADVLPDPEELGLRLYRIVVTVTTEEGREVRLSSLRLGPPT